MSTLFPQSRDRALGGIICSFVFVLAGCHDNSSASLGVPTRGANQPAANPVEAGKPSGTSKPSIANPSVPQEPSPFRFAEIAKSAGIDFVHFSGMTEAKHFPTANGSGVAIFDYDGDGKMDIYFATCTLLPLGT